MSGQHELKIWPQYFDAVIRGDKMFEVRGNDRDFQTGDTVILREWDPKKYDEPPTPPAPPIAWNSPPPAVPPLPMAPRMPGVYTGRECSIVITYVLHGGKFGLPDGMIVFSFDTPSTFKNEEGSRTHLLSTPNL